MNAERRRALESFVNAPDMLDAALRRFPRKMWTYKKFSGHPSIHDTVWYLADSEAVEYVFCRRLIAEPGSPVSGIDFSAWTRGLGYFYQDIKEAMEMIRVLRRATYRLLKTLREAAWTYSAEHPTHGCLTLDEWLQFRENVYPEHIEHMERIYGGWVETASLGKTSISVRKAPRLESFVP